MSTVTIEPTTRDMLKSTKEIFAEVTRYPLDILDEHASLEEDLGIDSVKLGEVFSVLRERYDLPEHLGISPEGLKTIMGISQALIAYMEGGATSHTVEQSFSQTTYPHLEEITHKVLPRDDKLAPAVIQIFAAVTRYPSEILDPTANLEEDLGIDSVKLGEVFSVLREKYHLPEHLGIPPEKLKTIAGISESLEQYLGGSSIGKNAGVVDSYENQLPINEVAEPFQPEVSDTHLHSEILGVFAEVTRYPLELLDPEANLEEDLGIDSVKLGEVFSVLRERYHLPEHIGMEPDQLKTIGGISSALYRFLNPADRLSQQASAAPYLEPILQEKKATYNGHVNGNGHHTAAMAKAIPSSFKQAEKPLEGKVAFISGSGRGLGKDIAGYLAGLGATVIINSFHSKGLGEATEAEILQQGGNARHIWGSMANPKHVEDIFDEIEAVYGGLDFFISNASNGMLAKLEDLTAEHWEKAFKTNIIGLHQSAMRAVELMKKRGGGKMITLSSPASQGYVDYFGCMGAVKAAVESLTRSLAVEMAKYNIQVNCVSPGPIYGELLNKWPESQRLIRQWEDNTAYDRLCEARDVSHFIGYLLGDDVKIFTGSVLVMDGGISSQGW